MAAAAASSQTGRGENAVSGASKVEVHDHSAKTPVDLPRKAASDAAKVAESPTDRSHRNPTASALCSEPRGVATLTRIRASVAFSLQEACACLYLTRGTVAALFADTKAVSRIGPQNAVVKVLLDPKLTKKILKAPSVDAQKVFLKHHQTVHERAVSDTDMSNAVIMHLQRKIRLAVRALRYIRGELDGKVDIETTEVIKSACGILRAEMRATFGSKAMIPETGDESMARQLFFDSALTQASASPDGAASGAGGGRDEPSSNAASGVSHAGLGTGDSTSGAGAFSYDLVVEQCKDLDNLCKKHKIVLGQGASDGAVTRQFVKSLLVDAALCFGARLGSRKESKVPKALRNLASARKMFGPVMNIDGLAHDQAVSMAMEHMADLLGRDEATATDFSVVRRALHTPWTLATSPMPLDEAMSKLAEAVKAAGRTASDRVKHDKDVLYVICAGGVTVSCDELPELVFVKVGVSSWTSTGVNQRFTNIPRALPAGVFNDLSTLPKTHGIDELQRCADVLLVNRRTDKAIGAEQYESRIRSWLGMALPVRAWHGLFPGHSGVKPSAFGMTEWIVTTKEVATFLREFFGGQTDMTFKLGQFIKDFQDKFELPSLEAGVRKPVTLTMGPFEHTFELAPAFPMPKTEASGLTSAAGAAASGCGAADAAAK